MPPVEPPTDKRPYESELRRRQSSTTHDAIVAAGTDLARGFDRWDWGNLTFRAVAEHSGVGERTVYRHFPNKAALHQAVMHQLEVDAGVSYDDLTLDDLPDVTAQVFSSLRGFQATVDGPLNESQLDADQHRRDALLHAIEPISDAWTETERRAVAGALDVIWGPWAYQRLIDPWQLDHDEAVATTTWMMAILRAAIERGDHPMRSGRDGA